MFKSRNKSRAGHVKSCLKIVEPSSNPKYDLVIDSELVARAKDEKNP